MINSIIQLLRKQAREHKALRAFYYKRNYELGAGNDLHPLFWLEDPISGRNQQHVFTNKVNFSILFIPKNEEEVLRFQNLAFSVGLNILERIKADTHSVVTVLPTWTYLTLRDYYDNNACGCRFSVDFVQRNMQDLCLIEEQFDTNKEFDDTSTLLDFEVKGSEVFEGKLPVFDLKISK